MPIIGILIIIKKTRNTFCLRDMSPYPTVNMDTRKKYKESAKYAELSPVSSTVRVWNPHMMRLSNTVTTTKKHPRKKFFWLSLSDKNVINTKHKLIKHRFSNNIKKSRKQYHIPGAESVRAGAVVRK